MTFAAKKACKDQFPQTSYESGPDVEISLAVLKIGDLILCGISGELMTEIGMEIKRQSPRVLKWSKKDGFYRSYPTKVFKIFVFL